MPDPESRIDPGVSSSSHVRHIVDLCRQRCEIAAATAPRSIRTVAIIGAGIMGTAIAIEHARKSIPVVLLDNDFDALRRAELRAEDELKTGNRHAITFTMDFSLLTGCDLVLESIVEKASAKLALYSTIEPHLGKAAILATNTSTIPISRLASGVADPGRFCGMHFCHPVALRPLVEVIAGPATSPATAGAAILHPRALGKLPLVVADGPGFVVNRLLFRYLNEALAMVASGSAIEDLDAAMVEFGMPMGPIEQLDEIGLDTALQSGVVLAEIFRERSPGTELLLRLVKANQLGVKTGSGFYQYPSKSPNPSIGVAAGFTASRREIPKRLLRPMVAEAERMLLEQGVNSNWEIDVASLFGLGFPPWRGGLHWWGRESEICSASDEEKKRMTARRSF